MFNCRVVLVGQSTTIYRTCPYRLLVRFERAHGRRRDRRTKGFSKDNSDNCVRNPQVGKIFMRSRTATRELLLSKQESRTAGTKTSSFTLDNSTTEQDVKKTSRARCAHFHDIICCKLSTYAKRTIPIDWMNDSVFL